MSFLSSFDKKFPYSRVSNKHKFIFIHVPKSAGTSIRLALGEPVTGRQHFPWWIYQEASARKFEKYFKFAFVRHPVDRLISGYNYLKDGGNNQKDDLEIAGKIAGYSSFEHFISSGILTSCMIYHPIFRPQSFYLCDWKGRLKVDFLGRHENIQTDFRQVLKEIGLSECIELWSVNTSRSKVQTVKFSNNVKKKIFDIYSQDFKIFNYEI